MAPGNTALYPAVVRCIFRTNTPEDYKTLIGKPPGSFSLQEEIAKQYPLLWLHQRLEATSAYPALTVVDLLPATYCCVEDGATFVVLPPEPVSTEPPSASAAAAVTSPTDGQKEERVGGVVETPLLVALDTTLHGAQCSASQSALEALVIHVGSLLSIGDVTRTCTFAVTQSSASDAMQLNVSPDLFRNIRAAYCAQLRNLVQTDVDYAATVLSLPLDALTPLEAESGHLLSMQDTDTEKQLQLSKVLLCPAVDDFVLVNLYGEHYADFFTTALLLCADQLQGRLVSDGDVLTLSFSAAVLQQAKGATEGLDTVESIYATVQHKVEQWDGIWLHEEGGRPHLLAFRVVEARGGRQDGCGVISVRAGSGSVTELSLVSQTMNEHVDVTPVYPPCAPSPVKMEIQNTLHHCLAGCLTPKLHGESLTLVVHGIKDNMPYTFVHEALRTFGVPAVFASVDSLNTEELRTLLENTATASGSVALVLKNAQGLLGEQAHLLPMVELPVHASSRATRLIVLVCETVEAVPPAIAARATNAEGVIECGNPSTEDRERLLRHCGGLVCRRYRLHPSLLLAYDALASWTVGLTVSDLIAYMEACTASVLHEDYPEGACPVLSDRSCEETLQGYLKSHGHTLVSTKLQPVRWSDVGGLEDAKRELRETIQLPLLHPELFASGMKKRTGLLFYGPPGCGKTLLAKAVATEMNMNFMSVKGPELINQYVGESEKNIRMLFQRARDNSPCIVFFDELDALAPARGAKGDAGGAMDRIVAQLLVEVDGVGQTRSDGTTSGEVFIIGATNRPDLLDPSLLRPGRFDRLCYLGIPSTKEAQLHALKALTRKFDLADDVNLAEVLAPLDLVYTGADFFALSSDAMMFAVEDALELAKAEIEAAKDEPKEAKEAAANAEESCPIKVTMEHFLRARAQLKPSVTPDDLRRYESLKTKFNK